mmetsp:Transcript_99260/g.281075  ORF Transcript_99260/g.281075 Transcript_99260/m.281075 type:complete len:227 (-) Transcript_99260:110-790(-)
MSSWAESFRLRATLGSWAFSASSSPSASSTSSSSSAASVPQPWSACRSKRFTRMTQLPTSWSSPQARICCTALADCICTKPRLLGRRREWHCGSPEGRTVECATSTRTTAPYAEKCCRSLLGALKPSLLMRRTMKRRAGSSVDRSCRLLESVCSFLTGGRCKGPVGSTGLQLTATGSASLASSDSGSPRPGGLSRLAHGFVAATGTISRLWSCWNSASCCCCTCAR